MSTVISAREFIKAAFLAFLSTMDLGSGPTPKDEEIASDEDAITLVEQPELPKESHVIPLEAPSQQLTSLLALEHAFVANIEVAETLDELVANLQNV